MELSIIDQARKRFTYFYIILWTAQSLGFLIYEIFWFRPFDVGGIISNIITIPIMVVLFFWTKGASNIKNITRMTTFLTLIGVSYLIFVAKDPFTVGIFFPIFPIVSFLFVGKKEGTFWLIPFFVLSALYLFGSGFGLFEPPKFLINPLIYLISIIIYLLWVYFYVDLEEKSRQLLSSQSQKQEEVNRQLMFEIEAKKKAESDLLRSSAEVKKMNDLMVGRELKMAELKKENEELKKRP